ncbi:hypothetical protein AB0425_41600 [Actinosynnema sp. NPDC051121]
MEAHARRRYEVVHCSVVGHAGYGLLVESEDGERGYVDSSHITDEPGEPWPAVGRRLPCVVLGYTKEGRLRAATTPLYVEMVAAADDPAAAVEEWSLLTGRGRLRG